MNKAFPTLLIASFLGGCVIMPPPNRSAADPADSSAREPAVPRKPNLIASTRIFLDPSAGEGAQKMDHSKMPGMGGKKDDAMPGMKHDGEPAKGDAAEPADKAATVAEMKRTADEMKKASDELKAKSDALQKRRGKKPAATPAPQPAKPEDHSQHQQ